MGNQTNVLPSGGLGLLQEVVNQAYTVQNRDFSEKGCKLFEGAFMDGLKELIETYGLGPTLRSFCKHQNKLGLHAFDTKFITAFDLSIPDQASEVDETVDYILLNWGSNIVAHTTGGYGELAGECRIHLTGDTYAIIPEWEVAKVVSRNREKIESERVRTLLHPYKDEEDFERSEARLALNHLEMEISEGETKTDDRMRYTKASWHV